MSNFNLSGSSLQPAMYEKTKVDLHSGIYLINTTIVFVSTECTVVCLLITLQPALRGRCMPDYFLRQLDLNLLIIFDAVVKEGSFSAAAGKLDLTQSAVSNAIGRLKKVVNDDLFVRQGRGIIPTAKALWLQQQFQEPLHKLGGVLRSCDEFDPACSHRHFKISSPDYLGFMLMPLIPEALMSNNISTSFSELYSEEKKLKEALYFQQLDLALDILPVRDDAISHEVLLQDDVAVLCSQNHPRIGDEISEEEFFNEKHISLRMKRVNLHSIDLLATKVLPRRQVVYECASLLSVMMMTGEGDNICIAPRHVANKLKDRFKLKILKCPFPIKSMTMHMMWHSTLDQDPAHQWLRKTFRDTVEKMSSSCTCESCS